FQADDAGSIPATRSSSPEQAVMKEFHRRHWWDEVYAHIAQQVEHFLGKEEVTGSNPVMSSNTPAPEAIPGPASSLGTWCRGWSRCPVGAWSFLCFPGDALLFRQECTIELRGRESWQRQSLNVINRT